MLKVAIVGCGKIADQHIAAIRRIAGAEVVALCDSEILMARQLGERLGVKHCFADLSEMLKVAAPDVVHITTPPQSHFSLARQCFEAGCHVYIEKPFTIAAEEARILIACAEEAGLKLTAGHNVQFTREMVKMRRLVAAGFLGGPVVHVESYFAYDLSDASYVRPILGSRNHWVRKLPGQLLHNIISHGVARLAEFLDDDIEEISAMGHQSPSLRALGGGEVLDELRVMIRDSRGATAFFCFSTQLRPGQNCLRIYGKANAITVDCASGSLIRHKNRSCKSYLTYFIPPIVAAGEHFRNALRNVWEFMTQRLHQDSGMKELIERFYRSIQSSEAVPIPYREIQLTARIMDEIFAAVYPEESLAIEQTDMVLHK